MEKRKLGTSSLRVSPLAFGGNIFGWTVSANMAFNLLDEFVALGCNFIDTADVYSHWVPGNKGGESETVIGNWMKQRGNREKVVIATKVGNTMGENQKGLSKTYIFSAIEASLQRLQTDYIDLYQSHYDDLTTPLEETLAAYGELIKQGKIRAIGASNYTAERLSQALAISKQNQFPSYQCLQVLYNLYDRSEYERELEAVCIKNNLGVISYFSLASGFLTGKYRSKKDLDKRARGKYVKDFLNERGFSILKALDEVSIAYHTTPASVAIAWLLAHQSITAPIASATNLEQLHSLIEGTQLQLNTSAMDLLNAAGS
jgi:aryl-alcohol dehydrogenase-like predicted oxidoreductase